MDTGEGSMAAGERNQGEGTWPMPPLQHHAPVGIASKRVSGSRSAVLASPDPAFPASREGLALYARVHATRLNREQIARAWGVREALVRRAVENVPVVVPAGASLPLVRTGPKIGFRSPDPLFESTFQGLVDFLRERHRFTGLNECLRLWKVGRSTAQDAIAAAGVQLARRAGKVSDTLYQIVMKELRGEGTARLSAQAIEDAARAKLESMNASHSMEEIGKELGMSRALVAYEFRVLGVAKVNTYRGAALRRKAGYVVAQVHRMTDAELGRQIGCTAAVVAQIRRRARVLRPSRVALGWHRGDFVRTYQGILTALELAEALDITLGYFKGRPYYPAADGSFVHPRLGASAVRVRAAEWNSIADVELARRLDVSLPVAADIKRARIAMRLLALKQPPSSDA